MKVKILKNVVVGNKVRKAGETIELDRKTAGVLIERAHAQEAGEFMPQQKQQTDGGSATTQTPAK